MKIYNVTKGRALSSDSMVAASFVDRAFGLLKSSNPRSILFLTRYGIHTIGLSTPIDVLVLDKYSKVVRAKSSLKPNRFYFYNPKYNKVIELPEGALQETDTVLGDKILIK